MKKLLLPLFLFSLVLISHGSLPAEKAKPVDDQAKVIISMEHIHEELPGSQHDDKKSPFALTPVALLVLTGVLLKKQYQYNRTAFKPPFLTPVFFQSNYVIKPL
ncbi:hypothetical protein [Mesobacillus subterraneus]|uniref:LPXTG cell wall anchor domain-containing protein n=1 Tax=Mesobacillus subterraneus TaxID=285983 RepID=A0A3R9DT05_9BACI|nr:hypothetical protein [Mesobacillus subterraneus]RSD26687.1 hypothetical protein EJA10_12500 [Mesobacillus subterraneus]